MKYEVHPCSDGSAENGLEAFRIPGLGLMKRQNRTGKGRGKVLGVFFMTDSEIVAGSYYSWQEGSEVSIRNLNLDNHGYARVLARYVGGLAGGFLWYNHNGLQNCSSCCLA